MSTQGRDFWSRRKADVAQEAMNAEEPTPLPEDLSDEEILVALDLPDPDTIALGDDIKGFMSKTVPDHLRRRALRKLWRLNPVLANVDGLVDYGEDFTDSATVIENMQTAYQVGKGMMAHVQEMARKAEALIAETPDDTVVDDIPSDVDTAVAQVEVDAEVKPEQETSQEAAVPRRRMRFEFEPEDASIAIS